MVDSTAPTVSSASVADGSPTTIALLFNEVVIASAISPGDFSIIIAGGAAAPATGAAITNGGLEVELTSGTAVAHGEVVTVTYTKSSTDDQFLEDASDNAVVTFTDLAVTNTVGTGTSLP